MAEIDIDRIRLKPGRPPKPDGAMPQIAIRLPLWMLEQVDHVIDSRRGQTERTTVIREMIARGLEEWADEARG